MLVKWVTVMAAIGVIAAAIVPVPPKTLQIGDVKIRLDERYFEPERKTFARQWLSNLKGWNTGGDRAGEVLAMLDYEALARDAGITGEQPSNGRDDMVILRPVKKVRIDSKLKDYWAHVKSTYEQCENKEPYDAAINAYRYFSDYGCNTYSILTKPLDKIGNLQEFWSAWIGLCSEHSRCLAYFRGNKVEIQLYMPYAHFVFYPKLAELLRPSMSPMKD